MDDAQEWYLLIETASVIMIALALTIFAVMIIYRKRKMEHIKEIDRMNETFARELLQTQLEVQQQTMQHIGREIHDNVGQKLTLAALYTSQVDTADPAHQKKMDAISSIIDESLSDLRSLSKNLTDVNYFHTDLYQLIHNECARMEGTGRCTVHLQPFHIPVKAGHAVKNVTLRILQEFLQNSLKHADCTVLTVALKQETDGLELYVTDNGKGFIIERQNGPGIGLSNMRKRAEIIHARFTIESTVGKGTSMRLFIPDTEINL
ncbi:hypothetical protein A4H97_23715 [Niastella yeongjuensis]|uniref:Oxygen sensor histidine kinase NreB n=1 Tax=Niastella yeongjuensis TaxID=354355 RepID=A0A1V9F595_9BACT|nr:ATP-binding protein [Niastella yeongjuensis]OQP53455.1 hypothetical protein A4H97_23715 [Niastella yeongjuensis]SEP11806.1 Histidine kinase-, DNA gyrase B-, and HSP90-like ATPase [Niastella yeongjuensis]